MESSSIAELHFAWYFIFYGTAADLKNSMQLSGTPWKLLVLAPDEDCQSQVVLCFMLLTKTGNCVVLPFPQDVRMQLLLKLCGRCVLT
ncbi:hypothetical protein ACLOJK_017815 [Asimina triloba]